MGVNHVVAMGLQTEYCVDTTCRTALNLDYDVTLIEDGHTTANAVVDAPTIIKHHNLTLGYLAHPERNIHVVDSNTFECGAA